MKNIVINPQKLSEKDAVILAQFLHKYESKNEFVLNYPYFLSEKISVTLTNPLHYWIRINPVTKKYEPRYAAISNKEKLGIGAYGGVSEIEATLAFVKDQQLETISSTNKHQRVSKRQIHSANNPLKNAIHESQINAMTWHLHAKPISYFQTKTGETISYMVIRKFPGLSLDKIIDKKIYLTLKQRLEMTINFLRAYQEQVYDCGIVHRDIKPGNVVIDPTTNEVNIIDFGLSRKAKESDERFCGTAAYCAPECLTRSFFLDTYSDIYSLGLSLIRFWGGDERIQDDVDNLENGVKSNPDLSNLFKSILGLKPIEKYAIENILSTLTSYYQKDRAKIADAIKVFDDILLAHKVNTVHSLGEKKQLEIAHNNAFKTYNILYNINFQVTDEKLTRLKNAIITSLNDLPDTMVALKEYIETLQVKVFKQASVKNKTDIKNLVNKIFTNVTINSKTLLDMLNEAKNIKINSAKKDKQLDIRLQNIQNKIKLLIDKTANRRVTWDDLNELNESLNKKIPLLQDELNKLKNGIKFHHRHFEFFKKIVPKLQEHQTKQINHKMISKRL